MSASFPVRFHIQANFPLTPVPTVPEIVIHKSGARSGLRRLAERDGDAGLVPYWASWWGGGVGLARHLLDHPDIAANRSVLDLGCGSGLVAIAAAKAGARVVRAVDIDPDAVIAAGLNAEANGVRLFAETADLTGGDPPQVDLVLAGDLFYEAGLAARVLPFLQRCRAAGCDVLIGDPGRRHLPVERLSLIAEYAGPDFGAAASINRVYGVDPPA